MYKSFRKEFDAQLDKAVKKGLFTAGSIMLTEAKKKCPVDTGTLRRSGAVEANSKEAIVSFNTPYAYKQHEDTTLNHPRGGEAKFLEKAAIENAQRAQTALRKVTTREINQGARK